MAMSDYGEEKLVTSASGITFDLNKDYAKAISEAKAAGQDTTELEAQRQAKIDSAAYGGQYQTGKNEAASTGTTYKANSTVVNRTSTSDPIVSTNPIVGVSSDYDKQYMSYTDVQAIEELSRLAKEAAASGNPNSAYHDAAEAIRAKYGYSGGDRGDEYIQLQQQSSGGSGDGEAYLRELYAQQIEQQLASLTSAYEQNLAGLKAQAEQIPDTYNIQRNRAAAQSDIDRSNFTEMAVAHGLNTGTTGQAELARSAGLRQNLATIGAAEADSLSDNALAQAQMEAAYRNAMAEAEASGNAALAEALYTEYVRQSELAAQQAAQQTQQDYETLLSVLGSSGSSYSGSGSSMANSSTSSSTSGIVETMSGFGSDAQAYEYLLGQGLSNAKTAQLWELYQETGSGSGTDEAEPAVSDTSSTDSTAKVYTSYNNSGVSGENVKTMQKELGVSADGKWGPNTQAAAKAAGWPTDAADAWAAYQKTAAGSVTDYWTGTSNTGKGNVTGLDWDQDEGIFVWNGKTYSDVEQLLGDIDAANLTDEQLNTLKKQFKVYGFDLS